MFARSMQCFYKTCPTVYQNQLLTICRMYSVQISCNILKGSSTEYPIVLAHGALGNKNNFNSLSKRLLKITGCSIVTYDARNHGKSMHSDTMTVENMSDDLMQLLDKLEIEKCVLVGHSMGGRMAMFAALNHPHRVDKLVVVDASPCTRIHNTSGSSRGSLFQYLKAMKAVKWEDSETLSSARLSADAQLKPMVPDASIRNFILTNVEEISTGKIGWRVNLDSLSKHLEEFRSISVQDKNNRYLNDSLFVAGGASPFVVCFGVKHTFREPAQTPRRNDFYIAKQGAKRDSAVRFQAVDVITRISRPSDYAHIKRLFPNATISHIPEAGHWVHSEKPHQFLSCVEAFLKPTFFPLFDTVSQ